MCFQIVFNIDIHIYLYKLLQKIWTNIFVSFCNCEAYFKLLRKNVLSYRRSGPLNIFRFYIWHLTFCPRHPPSQVEVSPLENAIEVIENKNLQLRTLITQCQSRQMQNINPLTMCLNGVIDAAVNGGLARYQEVCIDGWRIRSVGLRDRGRT